jgi:four helix bundle suffix protein
MVQAARSGKQNIAEGGVASGTSKETEIRLINVARASLEELLQDHHDFLRSRSLSVWNKESREAMYVRDLGARPDQCYDLYRGIVKTRSAEVVANIAICLIHQANYLLDRQLRSLERAFIKDGGMRERMKNVRIRSRRDTSGSGPSPS